MVQILFCDTSATVRIVYLVKVLLNITRYIIPVILIGMLIFDIYKNMLVNNSKEDIVKKLGNRIIACIIVFLIPTLINLLFGLIGKIGLKGDLYNNNFLTCYSEASIDLIKKMEENELEVLNKEEEETRKNNTIKVANMKALKQSQLEETKKSTSSYNKNTTDNTKQNNVFIKNGFFYLPTFKNGDTKTYSGYNCPKNPLQEGYNNKYGFNNYFWNMLSKMIDDSKKNGYNLTFVEDMACRNYQTQYTLYHVTYKNQPGRAAVPGTSNHGFGIAADLNFYINLTTPCSSSLSRTYANCPGMKWAHNHAKDYGLHFSMLNSKLFKEDWHIEPINIARYQ